MVKAISTGSGIGSVMRSSRLYGVTGRSTPTYAAISGDQAPAQSMTHPVLTLPSVVSTDVISSPDVEMPTTSTPVRTVAPRRRAPVA